MRISIVLLFFVVQCCYSQDNYNARLSQRLADIRALPYFDNGVVVYDDSSSYGWTFVYWTPEQQFYEDDIVAFRGGTAYRALIDSKGKNPSKSPNEWALISGPHPYLYLRDSAKTQDLVELLKSDHPYIRIYAFGALVNRDSADQFQIVIDNLADTSRIDQLTGDYGYTVFPADLMLWYSIEKFDSSKKDVLKKLILSKYSHLNTLEEILLFHKPTPEDYQFVRQIAQGDRFRTFGIIALSKYKKQEDVEIIRDGLKDTDYYYSGYKIIFMATENFSDAVFKKDLIEYRKEIMMDSDLSAYRYYFYSLAKYKDNECFKVLEEIVSQLVEKDDPYLSAYKVRNLMIINQGLKKYHISMYDDLIRKIEIVIAKSNPEDFYEYHQLEESPWNY